MCSFKERFLFLPGFCVSFCLGICWINYFRVSFTFLYITTLFILILILIFINRPFSILLLYLLGFLLGSLIFLNSQIQPNHLKNLKLPKNNKVRFKGYICSFPKIGKENVEFIFQVRAMLDKDKFYPTTGKLLVKVTLKDNFFYGEELILEGKLVYPFYNYYRNYLKRRQIFNILKVTRNNRIIHLERRGISFLKYSIYRLREKIRIIFLSKLSNFSSCLLNAIIIGDRSGTLFNIKDVFLKTGTIHILAISGLHIGIVGFIALLILKILRIPRKIRYILVIFILIIYCILTGASPSVLRATIMGIVILGGYLLKREVNIFNSLALSCILILFFSPQQLFEISFQLSFLTVLAIVLISPLIRSFFSGIIYKNFFIRFLILSFSVSVSSFLGIFPLVIYYFRIFSPFSILANMIVVPYMSVVVGSSFTLIISSFLFPLVSDYIAKATDLLTVGLFKINYLIFKVPFSYFKMVKISIFFILIYYSILLSMILIINFIKTARHSIN
ncbi:MAG: ComEC family competence protein [Candidatus Omnitrophica bacterium]|nr:ComEC family competence protein [Candidatus Omnitrophota bacterium]